MIKKLTSINKNENRKRYYIIDDLQLGLFDEYVMNVQWGRIGYRSRKKTFHFKCKDDFDKMLVKLLKFRKSHTYTEVDEIEID